MFKIEKSPTHPDHIKRRGVQLPLDQLLESSDSFHVLDSLIRHGALRTAVSRYAAKNSIRISVIKEGLGYRVIRH